MTTKQKKRLIQLPSSTKLLLAGISNADERDDYIRRLRRAGWTLQSISGVLGISRERVRQICEMNDSGSGLADDLVVPEPPRHEAKPPKRTPAEPSPETLARLLELKPLVQQVRSNAKRYRAEAEEYTRLLNHAHTVEGVSLYRLAIRLGVTHSALRFRLARYGYKPAPNATSKVYKPIDPANRAI